jgi:Co/Zn/Cd efflux system component
MPNDGGPRYRAVLWIALLLNAAMFIVEMVASLLSGSVSLQADALDFFGDAANYGITLFVLGMSLQARSYAALFKGLTMGLFGVWVLANALHRLLTDAVPDAAVMGVIGLLALVVNVCVAVMLFRFRNGDANARSIWLCSRNDAIGNIAVIAAASGVLATSSGWPDIAVAAIIASLSLSAAWQICRQAREEHKGHRSQHAADETEPMGRPASR